MKAYDSADLDAVQSLVRERGYELLRKRVEQTRQQLVERLIQPSDAEITANLRGQIAGIDLALELPKILEQDIRKGMKESA